MKLLFTIVLTLFGLTQSVGQIYEQCLPISGYAEDWSGSYFNRAYNTTTIRTNASKEIVLIGNNTLYRFSSSGEKLWDKSFNESFQDFSIDKDGGVYAINNTSSINFGTITKYNSNGSLAWKKNITNGLWTKHYVDDAKNVFVIGYLYSSELVIKKFLPDGTESWTKVIFGLSSDALTVSPTGDVYVLCVDPINFGAGYKLLKFSSTGNSVWSISLNYNFFFEELVFGKDGNVYVFLSDDFSTRTIKLNPSNGSILGNSLINLGKPVFKQGPNNTIFLLGFSPIGRFQVFKIDNSFAITLFKDTGYNKLDSYNYRAIEIDTDGSVLVNFIPDFSPSVFLRLSSTGAVLNTKEFAQVTTGVVIDSQGNYLFPTTNECLKKLTLCERINFSITNQPVNATICSGIDAQFTFGVNGLNLLFQWKKGTSLLKNSSKYSGVNSATLTIKSTSAADDTGSYTCEVFDACNRTLVSNSVAINFISSATITLQPGILSQCPGTDASFQITTTGGQNVKYQWRKGNTAMIEGPNAIGTKTNKLTLKGIASAEAGEYFCDVTSDCFTTPLFSQKGILALLQPLTVLNQPQSVTTCLGTTAAFSVSASELTPIYQWRKAGINLTESSLVTGTKTNTLSINDIKVTDVGDYTCVVTGACGPAVTSSMASLALTTSSQITTQPLSKSVCSGNQAAFSVTASGSSLLYSWKKGNVTLINGGKYAGVNTATLSISSVGVAEEGQYTCSISNPCGNDLVSNAAQLSISIVPVIISKSPDLNVCVDQPVLMIIDVNGGSFTYQWKKNGIAITDGDGISGSKTPELIIAKSKSADSGNYTCEVSSDCGAPQISGIIRLTVAAITTQPLDRKICDGDSVTFSVAANGTIISYQWKKSGANLINNTIVSGANAATLSIKNSTLVDQGLYTCEINTGCGNTIISSAVKLEINPRPDLQLLTVNCESFVPEWSSLVIDKNNVFGDYVLYEKGKPTPIPDLFSISGTGDYLIVKNNGVCSDTVEWNNICIITDVENTTYEVSVSPNPSSGILMINHPSSVEKIRVFDLKGVSLINIDTVSGQQTLMDMTQYAAGVYHVAFYQSSNRIISHRIIIQR